MAPLEDNLIKTLNLLTYLSRQNNVAIPKLSDEKLHTLCINEDNASRLSIDIYTFINTLETLAEKSYLAYIPLIDKNWRTKLKEFDESPDKTEVLKVLQSPENESIDQNFKEGIAIIFENAIPKNHQFDREGLMASDTTFSGVIEMGLEKLKNLDDDVLVLVILMPFRSIDRLLRKLNEGLKFSEIQDAGIWYDSERFIFHIGDRKIETSYNGKPNKEHFALTALFNNPGENNLDYDDIPEFDSTNDGERKAYYDALSAFTKKDPELPKIFDIHNGYFEINKDYLDHTH